MSFRPEHWAQVTFGATIESRDWMLTSLAAQRGGAGRDRTDDLRLAKAALPQLSYSPVVEIEGLVGLSGFEPLTSRLSAVRSNQLSYRPGINRVGVESQSVANAELLARSSPRPRRGDGTLKTRQARN